MPQPLKADKRRQAVPSIRGYVYQVWWSLYAWITLRDGEVLYLEGAEDFDTVSSKVAQATQVKETSRRLSLGRKEAKEALDHFLEMKERNPGRTIHYRYLTTARPGIERGRPFGKDTTGLEYWKNCQRSGRGAHTLQEYLLQSNSVTTRVREFLKNHSPAEVLRELIQPITWETAALRQADIEQLVLEQLIYRGELLRIPPSEAKKAVNRLLRSTLETACLPEHRQLTKAHYYSVFEEETSVRVSRADVQLVPVARVPFAGSRHETSLVLSSWAQSTSPPSLESVAARESVVAELDSSLRQTGLLVITGTTGMGKTTLAKQLTSEADKLLWISLRSMPVESRSQFCRGLALNAPSALESGAVVVLDDLQRDWFGPSFQDGLAHALIVLREMDVLIVITSPNFLPKHFARRIGLRQKSDWSAPPFSRVEIESFAEQTGCTKARAHEWSGIVEMHTRGHPQLVHAHLASLQTRGWPSLAEARDEIFQSPDEVRQELEDVRVQLLSGLPEESLRLLHYLSLMGSVFRRDHAIATGEQLAQMDAPGLAFDVLVGPWVEALHDNYFQISPLLSRAYESVFSESAIRDGRRTLAGVFANTGTASTVEVSSALMCAILGRNSEVLGFVSYGLIQNWSEAVGPTIASYLSWIAPIDLEGKFFAKWCPSRFSSIFRLLQFRVASLESPDLCDRIVERWDAETTLIESSDERKVHRISLCMAVVYKLAGTASLECTLPYVLRLEELRRDVTIEPALSEILATVDTPQDLKDFWSKYPAGLDFFTIMQRVQTVADLEVTIQFLDGLTKDDRECLLAPNIDDVTEPSFVHRPWVNESRKEKPDWSPIRAQLEFVMTRADSWGVESIYRVAALGIVVIDSEYLEDFEAAHDLLALVEEKFGRSPPLLEQRATVLYVEKRHDEALTVWREVFRTQRPHPLLPKGMHAAGFALSRRKAAISAAETGRWVEAIALFQGACQWAYVMVDHSYEAALKTDAALCAFRGGHMEELVELLDSAVSDIAGLTEEQAGGNVRITQRVVAHLLLWITTGFRKESGEDPHELTEPWVGFCSNPERPKEIETLPLMPIDALYVYLSKIEETLLQRSVIFKREERRLTTSSFAIVRSETYRLDMRKDFRRCDFRRFPEKVARLIRAYSAPIERYLKMKKDEGSQHQEEPDVSEIFVESREGEEPDLQVGMSIDALVGALLCVRLQASGKEGVLLEEWEQASGALMSLWPDLPAMLSLIRESREWSAVEAKRILHVYDQDRDRRMLATLVVGTSSGSDADALFYAHVLLFDALSQGLIKEEIAGCLADTLERQWRRLAGSPALLRTPRLSVPAILEACDSSAKGHRKTARILIAAELAVKMNPPKEMIKRFRDLAR